MAGGHGATRGAVDGGFWGSPSSSFVCVCGSLVGVELERYLVCVCVSML